MAINFPNSPNLYDVYTDPVSKNSYVWAGDYWTGFTSTTSYQVSFNIASIVVEDDSSPVGVVSTLDFADNLGVTFSAGVATVTGAGGIATGFSTTASINTTGVITAFSFSGSGASLTGLTGASAGIYGDSSYVPQITVDSTGKIVGISTIAISGGGGASSLNDLTDVTISAGILTSGQVLQYDGANWINSSDIQAKAFVSSSAPLNPSQGSLWYSSVFGRGFVWYNDGDSSQWVDFSPAFSGFSDWVSTSVGIHTLSNVGIGTTNPTSALTVKGNTSLESLNVSGVSTFQNNVRLGDGDVGYPRIIMGDSSDFYIYHSSVNGNILQDVGANGVQIWSNSLTVKDSSVTNTGLLVQPNSSTELYYNNFKKFETLGAGVTITGTTFTNQLSVSGVVTAASFVGDGSGLIGVIGSGSGVIIQDSGSPIGTAGTINFGDNLTVSPISAGVVTVTSSSSPIGIDTAGTSYFNQLNVSGVSTFSNDIRISESDITLGDGDSGNNRLILGSDGDLSIYHNSSLGNIIQDVSPAGIQIWTNSFQVKSYDDVDYYIRTNTTGNREVELYYASDKKFATVGTGITVTGTSFVDQLSVSGVATASSFNGNGINLSGIVTSITSGPGITINQSNGNVTVSSIASVAPTQWVTTNSGIHTTSNVGVGTTNPQTPLQVERYGVKTGFGTFSAVSGLSTSIDSFAISSTDFKTAEYTLHVGFGSYIQAQKILLMQNGTTAFVQEYAVMGDPDIIVSAQASISGGVCSLQLVPEVGVTGIVTYRYYRSTLL